MRLRSFAVITLSIGFGVWLWAQTDRPEDQKNPFAASDAAAIAAGKRLFDGTCQGCHGANAIGARGPALTTGDFKHGARDGEIFVTIRAGIRGTEMPPFALLTSDQVWQLVSYIRSVGPAISPVVTTASPVKETVPGDPAAGKVVFAGKGQCLSCHQVDGAGTPVGPELTNAGSMTAAQLQAAILTPGTAPAPQAGRGGGRGRGGATPATVTATTADGKVYRGARKMQDAFTIQMIDTAGVFRSFDKAALKDLKVDNVSLMPANFGTLLSAIDLTNVIAYMKTLNGPGPIETGGVLTWNRIRNSDAEPQNWLNYWGNLAGTHYSSLSQITADNVKNLQAQWTVPLPGDGIVESTPIVVDGIMYTVGPVGKSAVVLAIDARTGRELWRYNRPQKVTNPAEANRVNRGVTVFGNRLFFGTLDAALVALDTRSGKLLWEKQIGDTMLGYSITSPPLVVKDKIIVGMGGGEYGIRGYVDAYNPATGERLWRFNSIPGPGEFGHDTWEGDSWQHGAGGMWLTGSYDAELNTIYWTVGNPGPVINADVRKGDNLFTSSVVALDADTGLRKWHYQFSPNDSHDWDSTEDVVLVDRMWHGQNRKLLLHADRNGAFYVLDRTNGKMLQATKFVRATWVSGWDDDGKPIIVPGTRATPEGVAVYPAVGGGANFQAPSYSPVTKLFYTPYHDQVGRYTTGPAPFEPGRQFQGSGRGNVQPPAGSAPDTVGIMAIDPEDGKIVWKHELTTLQLSPGVLATGGNVVFSATTENHFIALDGRTGKLLWKFNAGENFPASPISYSVNGRQYVAISATNSLHAFALPE